MNLDHFWILMFVYLELKVEFVATDKTYAVTHAGGTNLNIFLFKRTDTE